MDYIINTPCGKIKGVKSKYEGVIAYKGIRYAAANRFEFPKLVTYWEGIYDATKYGNCSYQPRSFYNEEENLKKIFYYNEFRKGENYGIIQKRRRKRRAVLPAKYLERARAVTDRRHLIYMWRQKS